MGGFRSCVLTESSIYDVTESHEGVGFVWPLKMHHKSWNVGLEDVGNLKLCMASPKNEVFVVELDSSEFFQVSTGFHCIGCKPAFAFESIFAEDKRLPDFSHSFHISNQVSVGRSNPSWGTLFNTTNCFTIWNSLRGNY